jgi:hypothetical protein
MRDMTSLPNPSAPPASRMSFQQWLQHGEVIYQNAMQEYHALQTQMEELERRLATKQTELNQISAILNKPPVETVRRAPLTAAAAMASPAPITDEGDGPAHGPGNNNDPISRTPAGRIVRAPFVAG